VIDESELRIDVFRSSGADGVVTRAVRVTHIPSCVEATSRGKNSEVDDRAAAIREIERKLGDHPSD
jgi:protein subunit release factor A